MLALERESADFNTGRRWAIIDIGSNTVRLVVYGGSRRAPTVLWNEKVTARLGLGLANGNQLEDDAMDLALEGLSRYARLLEELRITDVEVVATAAAREANNGKEFLKKVRKTGLKPRLLSGEEEALVSAMGVIGAFPGAHGVVADLGGGSLELVGIEPDGSHAACSLPLGTLRLAKLRESGSASFKRKVIKALDKAGWDHKVDQPIYMVGGTLRSLAAYALRSSGSPLDDPHAFTLTPELALKTAKSIARKKPADLVGKFGVSAMRAAALPDAAALLKILLGELQPSSVTFSSWGLREGLLYQRLDPLARLQDPLLAGVSAFAAPRGGKADIAARIAGWTVEALPAEREGTERLRLAATMLALASMQIEPNLRPHQAMDWALHKRWIDLDASGRAAIAAAIAANCSINPLPAELEGLASPKLLSEATSWGYAVRLFRRLGANSINSFNGTALTRNKGKLCLLVADSMQSLQSRGTSKDLDRLASSLGIESEIQVVPDHELAARRFPSVAVTAHEPAE